MIYFREMMDVGAGFKNSRPVDTAIWLSVPCRVLDHFSDFFVFNLCQGQQC